MRRFIRRRLPSIILLALIVILGAVISLRIAAYSQEKEKVSVQDAPTNPEIKEADEGKAAVAPAQEESEKTVLPPGTEEPRIEEAPVEETPEQMPNSRYKGVAMSEAERELMAQVIYLEAGNQPAEGQQAVAEVILNRVIHSGFPGSVTDVLWQEKQFSVMPYLSSAEPGQAQFDAIDGALYGALILDADVVFFSRGAENDRVWGQIGDHVFCREYIWE